MLWSRLLAELNNNTRWDHTKHFEFLSFKFYLLEFTDVATLQNTTIAIGLPNSLSATLNNHISLKGIPSLKWCNTIAKVVTGQTQAKFLQIPMITKPIWTRFTFLSQIYKRYHDEFSDMTSASGAVSHWVNTLIAFSAETSNLFKDNTRFNP